MVRQLTVESDVVTLRTVPAPVFPAPVFPAQPEFHTVAIPAHS